MFKALRTGAVTLHLISEDNLAKVSALFQGFPDSPPMLAELFRSYRPRYEGGRRTNSGFY